jgi:2-keto-myo-inositol isomerase
MTNPFALNHMTVAKLRYDQALSLASQLGCIGVEFRNDLSGTLFDGDEPETVRLLAEAANQRILGLSEVKMFNDWSDARRDEAGRLMEVAKKIGAESISLIPRCDGLGLGNGERQANLRAALRELLPMLRHAKLIALVEPLGFEHSSLRFKEEAMDAIEGVGGRHVFKLVHDTFHHTLAGETALYPVDTGIVHVSGLVDSSVSVGEMKDAHRILVDANDRLGNVLQLREIIKAGYEGPVSFEAFSPLVHEEINPFKAIKTSMDFIAETLTKTHVG